MTIRLDDMELGGHNFQVAESWLGGGASGEGEVSCYQNVVGGCELG